jgi:hypothetical protein
VSRRGAARLTTALFLSLLGLAGARAARPAWAGTEEFSTFDVAAQEEDDESLLDHYLVRTPRAWRDEWEHATQAIRTAQGCLTSGEWFIETDLKLRSSLGRRANFGLDLRQSESDAADYNYLDFSFKFPTRFGTPGAMFRPLHEKSQQDFALTWEMGSDTSAYQLQTIFTLEDGLNNFWAFRQTRVGQESEPYLRHPYEPGLRLATRHARWRAEVMGRYLTPSRRMVIAAGQPSREATLWGTLSQASVEVQALGLDWEAAAVDKQAKSTELPLDFSTEDNHDFRREWYTEVALRRRVMPLLAAEAHWLYQERGQHYGPPVGPGRFQAVDRLLTLETTWYVHPQWRVRVGGLYDEITIARYGNTPFSYGSRHESRAYLGLLARLGRVSMGVTEGIELDPEPYDVWFVHDKGFFHLQTTF